MVDEPEREEGNDIHNREIEKEVSVAEVMNKTVITMDINTDIPAIAREMVKHDVGSVIITEKEKAMGIITERDLVRDIIAKDRQPSKVHVSKILSSPLVTVEPETSVVNASEMMLKANIKRLPVLEDGTIIGVVSNTDILMVTPGLSTILKDLIDMNREALLSTPSTDDIEEDFSAGICESCSYHSVDLKLVDGKYLCENCRQAEGEDYE
ncbi:putative manganese-dependent inorganic pyrophosphatase [Methanosarcina lacustris Z-7289]|uniref:Putative manganese-dependent inorganic pyrophosphatase n=1 Tax=Methanosarcina lacustris Z-7289 TaxID=1434111 RepID=A0A0E3WSP3_9EURY|nr:CBS domain-containing protein [Methanosarcina lacustris]AKB73275.1 putative manganese-dependent inorganic pyrophosphatase [Methanosarcina lacustris Z-7289]